MEDLFQSTVVYLQAVFFFNGMSFILFLKEAVAFNVECLEHDLRYECLLSTTINTINFTHVILPQVFCT